MATPVLHATEDVKLRAFHTDFGTEHFSQTLPLVFPALSAGLVGMIVAELTQLLLQGKTEVDLLTINQSGISLKVFVKNV